MRKLLLALYLVAIFVLPSAVVRTAQHDWSTTAASNTTLEGISWAEGMAPSNVNNGVRAIAAALKEFQLDLGCQATSSGTDAIALTSNSAPAALQDGDVVCFTAGGTNTGDATFNYDTLGAQDIKKYTDSGLTALAAGDITSGGKYYVVYEATGTDWIVLNPSTVSGALLEATLTTRGDLIRRGASASERVALGSSGEALVSDGTDAVWGYPTSSLCVSASDETTAITATTNKIKFAMPYAYTLTGIRAFLTTPQTSGATFTVDVHEAGTTIMDTNKLTWDNGENSTQDAATAPALTDTSLADDAIMSIDVDAIGDGTAKGLKVCLIGAQP